MPWYRGSRSAVYPVSMQRLKNRGTRGFIAREPFAFRVENASSRKQPIDYCGFLARPGYHDEDIYRDGLYNTLWGRTFFLEKTNHPGLSVCYHVDAICPGFAAQAEYETGPIPPNLRKKLAKNRAFRKFTFQPVQVSVLENDREIEFSETRRDYYWELRPQKDDTIGGYVRSTAEAVDYENCTPDRHTAYFHSQDGVELVQTTTLYQEVVLLHLKVINVSSEDRSLRVRICDKRGMGFDRMLDLEPPAVRTEIKAGMLASEYVEWPLAGLTFIQRASAESIWQLVEGDAERTFFSERNHDVRPGQSVELSVLCACGFDAAELSRQIDGFRDEPGRVAVCARNDWNGFFADVVPTFTCSDKRYEELYYWSFFTQRFDLEDFYWDRQNKPHVCPRRGVYPGALWVDSNFNAVIDKWLNDPAIALLNADAATRGEESGCIGTPALAIWECYTRDPRREVLDRCLAMLRVAEEFYTRHDRSGSLIPSLNDRIWDYPHRWAEYWDGPRGNLSEYVQMVDVASMAACHFEVAGRLYRIQGNDSSAAANEAKCLQIKRAVNQRMWNPATGFYHDATERDGAWLACKAASGFVPMLAGIPDRMQASSLIRHLQDEKDFRTPLRVPTISQSSVGYNPTGYWYGCVWAPLNWMIIEGLANYDAPLASQMIHEWVRAATRDGYPESFENYSALGRGQCLTMQSWAGLIADLLIRRVMGVVLRPDDSLEFHPFALKKDWEYASFENFRYKGHVISVFWRRKGRKTGEGIYRICVDDREIAAMARLDRIVLEHKGGKWQKRR